MSVYNKRLKMPATWCFTLKNIKDNQRLHIQAWGPQTYKIWWVGMNTSVDYIKTQYMTSSWACENNKKNNQQILFTAVDYIKTQ